MFSFTNIEKTPNITVLCDCGRTFTQEEMYCCFYCHYAFCRYCCSQDIHLYFCRNCLENPSNTETFTFKSTCGNCAECPICKNILTITVCADTRKLHFFCQFCFWNSKTIGLLEEKIEELLTSCANKTKDTVDPKQSEFQRLQGIFKSSEAEIEKAKKLYQRIKRKSISLVLPSLGSKDLHKKVWTHIDFEKDIVARAENLLKKQNFLDKNNIKSFRFEKNKNEEDKIFLKTADIYKEFYDETYLSLEEELSVPHDSSTITNVEQRLSFPMNQPVAVNALLPKPLTLLTRKSKKCRKCSKFVVKFEKSSSIFIDFRITSFLIENSPKVMIKYIKLIEEPEKCYEIILTFSNITKHNILVYLENLDEEMNQTLNLREGLIFDNYEFKMDSVESLDLQRIKKEKEKSEAEGGNPPTEKEKKPPGKMAEPEIVKTLVPIRVALKDDPIEKEKPLKFGLKIQLKIDNESDVSTLAFNLIVNFNKKA